MAGGRVPFHRRPEARIKVRGPLGKKPELEGAAALPEAGDLVLGQEGIEGGAVAVAAAGENGRAGNRVRVGVDGRDELTL